MVYNAVLDVKFSSESNTEPLTQNEVKNWLRLSSDTDLALAELTAKSARIILERYTNISFIQRTVKAVVCNLQGSILLPYCPYVNGLTVKDIDGNAISDFKIIGNEFVNLLHPKQEYLTLEYSAGYATLPNVFKDAIKQQLAYMWENRGDETIGINNIAKMTLAPFVKVF